MIEYCADCHEQFEFETLFLTFDGNFVCDVCLRDYLLCSYCSEWYPMEMVSGDYNGSSICDDCACDLDECDSCGCFCPPEYTVEVEGMDIIVCPNCDIQGGFEE